MMGTAFRTIILVLAMLLAAAPARANFLVEMSYAQKVAASSQVVVGRVTRILPPSASPYGRVNEVEVLATVKGRRVRRLLFYGTSPIAEDELDCCRVGRTYLLFLERGTSRIYSSINGHYGVIRLDGLGIIPIRE